MFWFKELKETNFMFTEDEERKVRERYEAIKPFLYNELQRRVYAGAEAKALGYGGISLLSKITRIDRETIKKGIKEIEKLDTNDIKKIRKSGGGRKKSEELYSDIKDVLEELLSNETCGDPESALKWTKKSLHNLEEELKNKGYQVSYKTVHRLLTEMDYSMQGNMKMIEGGSQHVDRDEQFKYINTKVSEFQSKGQPVISIDTKKKELIGNFKNNGKEYRPKGEPIKVNVHDFEDKELGSVRPYGVYDITNNQGWVNLGTDKDTATFAVESIRRWWEKIGKVNYPNAAELLITADGGGSNSSRGRLWKVELQKLSSEIGIEISVCHYPPGTSKWNKIEHRMFSYISQNWRGKPLESHEVVINLIGSTKTKTGLNIECILDSNKYEKGIKVSDEQMEQLNIMLSDFCGNWNYTIKPKP
jgi:Rhodopirellula transposase DDE domain